MTRTLKSGPAGLSGTGGTRSMPAYPACPASARRRPDTADLRRRGQLRSRTHGRRRSRCWVKQLPMALGDDLDAAVGHFDGGLSVHGVSRALYPGGPAFRLGQALVRAVREVEVREDAEIDDSQQAVVTSGRRGRFDRTTLAVGSPELIVMRTTSASSAARSPRSLTRTAPKPCHPASSESSESAISPSTSWTSGLRSGSGWRSGTRTG